MRVVTLEDGFSISNGCGNSCSSGHVPALLHGEPACDINDDRATNGPDDQATSIFAAVLGALQVVQLFYARRYWFWVLPKLLLTRWLFCASVGFASDSVEICDGGVNGTVLSGPPAENDWKGAGWFVKINVLFVCLFFFFFCFSFVSLFPL